jgi:hypothetical protein
VDQKFNPSGKIIITTAKDVKTDEYPVPTVFVSTKNMALLLASREIQFPGQTSDQAFLGMPAFPEYWQNVPVIHVAIFTASYRFLALGALLSFINLILMIS